MASGDRVLILSDGGLPSLVATAAAASAGTAVVCPLLWERAESPTSRFAAVMRQAELAGLKALPPLHAEPWAGASGAGVNETLALIHAAYIGAGTGNASVLWPMHAGPGKEPDLDRVALTIDRALLVTRLAAMDAPEHGCPSIRVETPYADFTDGQLAELALDLDAPVHACWWWGGQGGSAASERQRWMAALEACGWVPV
jgi:hypothetical protein